MGNAIGGIRRRVKVMKVDGETFKFKSPVRGWDVLKDHPGLVLLDADDVKRYGIRAKPVEPQMELKSRKIYFLVELPNNNNKPEAAAADLSRNNLHRKVQSGINMSAKDRLELLMLSKRSASDVIVRPSSDHRRHHHHHGEEVMMSSGTVRLKMRLPKSQVAKMVEESRDGAEVAAKIMDLYKGSSGGGGLYSRGSSVGSSSSAFNSQELSKPTSSNLRQTTNNKSHHPKRVSFLATDDVGVTKTIDSQYHMQLPSHE